MPIIMNDHLEHRGNPCFFCKQNHDDVSPGKCPAFEEDVRAPKAGERFLGCRGFPVIAMFDFEDQFFPIFRNKLEVGK